MQPNRGAAVAQWTIIPFYLFAGFVHVTKPGFFLPVVPGWVPSPRTVVLATGVCEIAGAIGLALPRLRAIAGIMLALYAVGVFPANIQHAVRDLSTGTGLGWWYHAPRLFAQPLIVWWALVAGSVVDRPRLSRA
jgi:uncharacterized membrane protein